MKKTIIILTGLIGLTACSQAQTENKKGVPEAVRTAFLAKFPQVEHVKWDKEDGNFEAEFQTGSIEYSAVFTASGEWKETEQEIEVNQLPQAVKDYLAKNNTDKKVKEAAKITYADGKISYEAEINGKDLLFDDNGNLLH